MQQQSRSLTGLTSLAPRPVPHRPAAGRMRRLTDITVSLTWVIAKHRRS